MKKALLVIISSALPLFIILSSCVMLIAMIASDDDEELLRMMQEQEDQEESIDEETIDAELLEDFTITGSERDGVYTLTFKFKGWKIKDVKVNLSGGKKSGSYVMYVDIPGYSGNDRKEMAYQFFRSKGFTAAGACGMMANIESESAGTWRSNIEEGITPSYRGETVLLKGYGLCQWTNTNGDTHGRRYKVIQYLKQQGASLEKDSDKAFIAELEYAITEKGYSHIAEKIKKSTNAEEAAKYWCTKWERPANMNATANTRAKTAKKYLKKYSSLPVVGTGKKQASLRFNYKVDGDDILIQGRLGGTDIAGTVNKKTAKGDGEYGQGATAYGGSGMMNPYGKEKFTITSLGVAYRTCPFHGRELHQGWDLQTKVGGTDPIYAVLGGKVIKAGPYGGYGSNCVVIQSGKYYILYGHMSSKTVSVGDNVRKGQKIGTQGTEGNSTGHHLHLEFHKAHNLNDSSLTACLKQMTPILKKYARNYSSMKGRFKEIVTPN